MCGAPFEAKTSRARFCGARCRKRHQMHPDVRALVPSGAPALCASPAPAVELAVVEARRLANELYRLSASAPAKLRPGCRRMADAIALAIEAEGW